MEHQFLSEVPAQALQQALQNLVRAYTNFFQKRADFPKFKKKGQRESFRVPQGFKVDNQNGRVKVPKMGWMRYRKSQEVLGEAKNITLSESGGRCFVPTKPGGEPPPPHPPPPSGVVRGGGVANLLPLPRGKVVARS